jgi:hypothetical protein
MSARGFAKLGSKADGAIFGRGVRNGKGWNTSGVTVHVGETAEINMAEALMPQEAEAGATEGTNDQGKVTRVVRELGQTDGAIGSRASNRRR